MGILRRSAYLGATYTGQRAAWNRLRSIVLPASQAAALDGVELSVGGATLRVRVHARVRPAGLERDWRAGMISLCLVNPPVWGPWYRLLLATSHFGCGHLEVAFCERRGEVVVYGVRNLLRSNLDRVAAGRGACWIRRPVDETEVLRLLIDALSARGFACCLAAPVDCARLCVDPRLLAGGERAAIMDAIRAGYRKRWRRVIRSGADTSVARTLPVAAARPFAWTRGSVTLAALALHPLVGVLTFLSFTLHLHGESGGWPARLGFGGGPDLLSLHAQFAVALSWSLALGFIAAGLVAAPRVAGFSVGARGARWLDCVAVYAVLCLGALCTTFVMPYSPVWS